MNKKTIKHLISQLKKGDICVREIPMEYRDLPEIIAAERRFGLRRVSRCGYDIISNRFFVEDEFLPNGNDDDWSKCVPEYFEDFESYSSYLDGNIYENACYYQFDPKRVPAGITPEKLFERNAFIDYTIDDFTLLPTEEEQTQFDEVEKRKPLIKKWIKKFNECSSSEQLTKVFQGYKRSVLGDKVDLSFFIWNYIFEDVDNLERLQSVMEFVQDNGWFKSLCEYDCFIEVKSFHGKPHFYWSENEKETSVLLGDAYYIYLVEIDALSRRDYKPLIIRNPNKTLLESSWIITPQSYYVCNI